MMYTNKEGTYNVTYKVTDKQGASSTKTITIDVIERIVIPENKPVDTRQIMIQILLILVRCHKQVILII